MRFGEICNVINNQLNALFKHLAAHVDGMATRCPILDVSKGVGANATSGGIPLMIMRVNRGQIKLRTWIEHYRTKCPMRLCRHSS